MDNREPTGCAAETSRDTLSQSILPRLFLVSYHGDPFSVTAPRKYTKSGFLPPPFAQKADDANWHRNFNFKVDKIADTIAAKIELGSNPYEVLNVFSTLTQDLQEWLVDEAYKADASQSEEIFSDCLKNILSGDSSTTEWQNFEKLLSASQNNFPNNSITKLYEFIQSKKHTFFDEVELLLFMVIAWLEHQSINNRNEIGQNELKGKVHMPPLTSWLPECKEGRLKTTRHNLIGYYYKNCFKDKERSSQRMRGEPEWNDPTEITTYGTLNINSVVSKLGLSDLHSNQISQLKIRFHLAYFLGWHQLEMLHNGIPAERIVESYSRIDDVRERFYKELMCFVDKRPDI